jgi:thioredoxin-like negative regulator of GroEL
VSARSTAVRVLIGLVATAATAWFALLAVQSHATDAAAHLAQRARLSAAEARHGDSLLNTAAILYPGQEVTVLRAKLAFAAGHVTQARRLAADAANAEPGNPNAWLELTDVSHGTPELGPAFRHLVSLVPPVH